MKTRADHGRPAKFKLADYPTTGLARARELARANIEAIHAGRDPRGISEPYAADRIRKTKFELPASDLDARDSILLAGSIHAYIEACAKNPRPQINKNLRPRRARNAGNTCHTVLSSKAAPIFCGSQFAKKQHGKMAAPTQGTKSTFLFLL